MLDFVLGSRKFFSLHDLKGYLDNHPLSPAHEENLLEKSSDTVCTTAEEGLMLINDPEFTSVLIALCQKHGQNHSRVYYTTSNNPDRSFYAISDQTGEKTLIPHKDYLFSMQLSADALSQTRMKSHHEQIGSKIADFVCALLKEFPMSCSMVLKTLFERFPYKKLPIELQYHYFKTMLGIALRCANAEEQIISYCIEKFLQIDVDVKTHWRNTIILDTEKIQQRLNKSGKKIYSETEKKIDVILGLFIDYVDQRLVQFKGINDLERSKIATEDFIDMILKVFEEKILPSHKTNYVQYILLYMASIPDLEIFRQKFVSLLLINSSNKSLFIDKRIVLLNYFASFIGICEFIESELVIEAIKILLAEYNNKQCSQKVVPAITQCLAYMICYKFGIIRSEGELMNDLFSHFFNPDLLSKVDPNVLNELSETIKGESAGGKKMAAIAAIEAALSKQVREGIVATNSYWYFAGINYLPSIKQRVEMKLSHLTLHQKLEKQRAETGKAQKLPSPTAMPKKLLGKKRRASFEHMDDDECIKKGLRICSSQSSPINGSLY